MRVESQDFAETELLEKPPEWQWKLLVVTRGSEHAAQSSIFGNVIEFNTREQADFAYSYLDGSQLSNGCRVSVSKLYPFDVRGK